MSYVYAYLRSRNASSFAMDRILGRVKIVLRASSATLAPFVVSSSFWVAKNMACSPGIASSCSFR